MENKVLFTLCAFLVLTLYYPVIGLGNTPEQSPDPPNPAMDPTPEEATSNTTSTNNGTSPDVDNSTVTDTAVEDPTVPSVKQLSTPALLAASKESGTPETSTEVPTTSTFGNTRNDRSNLADETPPSALQPLNPHPPATPTSPIDTPHTTGHPQVSTVSSHNPPNSTQPNISLSHTTHHPKKADSTNTTAIPNPTNKADAALPETTTTSVTTTAASQPSSASSPSQPNEVQSIKPSASPSPEGTVSPELQPQTSSPAQYQSPSTQPSSPSAQAKVDAETPSRLNVGGDAVVVHEATSLDPLLAALVSAFVVAAAIVTLLVFLKLRRRDNQPEFHRLQDLPMDDMMEDAPLSMYTY